MMGKVKLSILASQSEAAVFDAACAHMSRALSEGASTPWTCGFELIEDGLSISESPPRGIVLVSLVSELQHLDEPWPRVEERLRKLFEALAVSGDSVFVGTIFRHAGQLEDPAHLHRRRQRIRRLNLFVANISRETGVFVVDIDRVFTDQGARRLQTDFTLKGPIAADLAGKTMAIVLLSYALDGAVDFDTQDAAVAILKHDHTELSPVQDEGTHSIMAKNVMAMGQGRRKQVVATVTDTNQDNHVGWLIRQVLKRQIAPNIAFDKVVQAIRRRGARESMAMLVTGLLKQFNR